MIGFSPFPGACFGRESGGGRGVWRRRVLLRTSRKTGAVVRGLPVAKV